MKLLLSIIFCILISYSLGRSYEANSCPQGILQLVESLPVEMDIQKLVPDTYSSWMDIIQSATNSIDLAEFYFTLTDGQSENPAYGGYMGLNVFNSLVAAGQKGVSIRIVQNEPTDVSPDTDSAYLAKEGLAQVRSIDWEKIIGAGILHTKLIIVDKQHAYLGSANADWRSLSQVKELGVTIKNCPTVVSDVQKIFEMYWQAAEHNSIPVPWPSMDQTTYNVSNPISVNLNGQQMSLFFGSSPSRFCTTYRTNDIDALVDAINKAQQTISVEVMDYAAGTLYKNPNIYWPVISDALKTAAFSRNVKVKLLFSQWKYTNNQTYQFMYDLASYRNIEVKLLRVPDMKNLPYLSYTRVNHAKFMVSEKQAYIGTNNWSADYYLSTGGISWNIFNDDIRSQAQAIFDRDWNSKYSTPLTCNSNFMF